jgi:mRNA interferase HigB
MWTSLNFSGQQEPQTVAAFVQPPTAPRLSTYQPCTRHRYVADPGTERYFAERSGHRGIDAARAQYRAWLAIAEASDWRTPQDLKRAHPKASILKGGRVVFNIKANDYRLIAMVQYRDGVLIIRFFGSHEDYDKVNAEAV